MSEMIDNVNFNPIEEIQIYLKEISKQNPEIVIVHTDGIFDSETKAAVIKFQELYSLPPTGIVDLATWSKLVYEYNKISNTNIAPSKLDCFPANVAEVKLKDEKDIVYIIQILINNFSKRYKNFNQIVVTGVYDESTETAVKQFQSMNKLSETGITDIKTWNSLTSINNICRLHDE